MNELRQLLVASNPDVIFLCETKLRNNEFETVRKKCRLDGCFVVYSVGRRGGLALLWKEEVNVQVQSFSNNHVDALVHITGID